MRKVAEANVNLSRETRRVQLLAPTGVGFT